jgi:hypothetical protein
MKYRQRGYRDSERSERDRPKAPPPKLLTPEERAQQRALKHAVAREANEVVRCPNCGRNVQALGAITAETRCPHCAAALHCCRACRHFDTSARWECRRYQEIPQRVPDKGQANSCAFFEGRVVLDATGKRTSTAASGDDPKSQFESLFKLKR